MGVPRLFPWLTTTFPTAVKHFQEGEVVTHVNCLYLDANGLLHVAAQTVYNYGANARRIDPYASLSEDEKMVRCFELFFQLIVKVAQIVVPDTLLFIAIDGPAPLAKQAQQRQRRSVAALTMDPTVTPGSKFSSNAITPGTIWMFELTKFMHYAIRAKIAGSPPTSIWKKIEVIFSPPTVPGEGEHIIMDHIRSMPVEVARERSHCIFGPDGDLIMLCLAAHLPKIHLFRDDQYQPGFYHLLDMGMVRERLAVSLGQRIGVTTKRRSLDDISNDFVLAGFFVGNDFLPKIQMFMYLEQGLELMIATYANISKGGVENVLTAYSNGRSGVSLAGFTRFVEELARREHNYILDQASIPPVDPRFKNETLLRHVRERPGSFERPVYILDMAEYRKDYYLKSGITSEDGIQKICLDYLRCTVWVYDYYVTGLPSWSDFYPWHYAPLMTDLASTMRGLLAEPNLATWRLRTAFIRGEPSLPFVQLLSVLPPSSSYLLPQPFRTLFTDPNSPLVRAGFYPKSFSIDYEGKTKEHMGVALLPFVEVETIREAYTPIAKNLKNSYVRNSVGRNESFRFDPSYTARYESDYGTIEKMHVRKVVM